ncbi:MAG: RNA methyltransferase [Merismopedia sp. SIO2A8]|nr:RNA methyltransferase [Symploca sp. SIO2B6]NET47374.1 RNA methyltransferase [Merismopedia sp. SIO2A8]
MTHIAFILVESEEDGNLGAAARALHTMGHDDFRLVRPKANHLSGLAKAMAHGSQHLLESAPVYDTLADALDDLDIVCATTARHRQQKYQYVSIRDLPEVLHHKGQLDRVGFVFGGERSGLSTKDLEQCDLITTIPQSGLYPSLNLAQAIMVYSFVFSEHQTRVQIKDQRLNSQTMPPPQYASLKTSILRLMDRIGLSERYKSYVTKALPLLRYEDLYLLHNIRSQMDKTLNRLEKANGESGQ